MYIKALEGCVHKENTITIYLDKESTKVYIAFMLPQMALPIMVSTQTNEVSVNIECILI